MGYAEFIDFMFGDFIEFWRDYRYALTPSFSQPVWLALRALGSLILLRIAPQVARMAAILFLGFYGSELVERQAIHLRGARPGRIENFC